MNKWIKALGSAGLALVVSTGCADLDVENLNAPDRERALSTPSDIETLISGAYLSVWRGSHEWTPGPALSVMGDEHSASWGNFMMKDASQEPRAAINNDPSYSYAYVMEDPWNFNYGALSAVRDGLIAIESGIEIGANGEDTERAIAFGRFVQGLALGHLALLYDQAFIVDETTDLESATLQGYGEIMAAAISKLEMAISASQANSFDVPPSWMAQVGMSNTELAQLAHSYIARFMTQVGRNASERAAVNWASVISHLDAGITEDYIPIGDGDIWWDVTKSYGGTRPGWARIDLRLLGPSDQSGAFQDWLATVAGNRQPFDIDTDDRRITGGAPDADGLYFMYEGDSPFRPERGTYHFSPYGDSRWKPYNNNQFKGEMDEMTMVELELIRAEALYNLGQKDAALAIVNSTRVANGQLPEATLDGDQSARCVPRTASGACGDLWEAIKYEKRIEIFHTGMGIHFFDDRGWGDLVEGTAIHFPVPGKELLVLLQEIYTFGGVGQPGASPDFFTGMDVSAETIALKAAAMRAFNEEYVSDASPWKVN